MSDSSPRKLPKPRLGAHMSIAGGLDKAVQRARDVGCACLQVFTKNNNQWKAKPIDPDTATRFRTALNQLDVGAPLAHSSYLINLASPDGLLWKRSIDAMVIELARANQLGIPYVVVHPGAFTSSNPAQGLRRIIRALNEVHRQTPDLDSICLLENTAGQGTCLGWQFEQLATLLDGVKRPERLGVCIDTCHAFAAGYPLAAESDYRQTVRLLNRLIGISRVKAIHVNDSKRELGSRVDRHEHIGVGKIGRPAFARLMNDRRFRKIPMYLETPKEDHPKTGKPWDIVNLRRLRRMIGRPIPNR